MKKFYSLLFVLLSLSTFGQTIFYEGFDYTTPGNVGGNLATTNDAIGSNNWLTHSNTLTSGTGTIDVLSGSLSYSGLAASTGNKVLLPANQTTTPRDINRALPTVTGNVLYYSLLLNVVDNTQIGTNTQTDGYFFGFGATAGTSVDSLAARLSIITTNSGGNYRLSIGNNSGGTIIYTDQTTDLNFATSYLVVVKLDKGTSPVAATLWVNPSTLGGTEPTTGGVTNTSGTSTFSTFASVFIRNSSRTPKVEIDEIKVGYNYADVTGSTLSNSKQDEIVGLQIYPNPIAKESRLSIISDNTNEKNIKIFDVIGKLRLEQNTNSNYLDISTLQTGIYFLKITQEGKTATRKLVVR